MTAFPRTRLGSWTSRPPLAVALDVPDGPAALRLAAAVAPHVAVLKVGLGLFHREGPGVVTALRDVITDGPRGTDGLSGAATDGPRAGGPAGAASTASTVAATPVVEASATDGRVGLFLDLKLHDIPNTVAAGMRSVARLAPRYVTVHAAGGAAMVRAAVDAAPDVEVAAVTVLTSLGGAELAAVGFAGTPLDVVRRLAALAVAAGARAVVCSPWEVAAVRSEIGSDVTLITPGIRAAGSRPDDQARAATPAEAVDAGSDLLVVGRPIIAADDPGTAAARFVAGWRPGHGAADLV
ncbi:orotidine-5'-phosphate decarboxylase [Protofrankia sp. BMG5.30]|uniref:orotidine-5'-phosphate decarboxylase n=1 Tax=Protofrankia sp. BMG5.30 TaxID=1834514 RepID=UPI000976715C|nr:orotidine-5'-phosphate decarboxylase [Protofrankia sp. BMG5.30]ONH34599.1 orotidine 5'-phosphate decarboxylase [Protofrankia sp. BMG5.30]